MLQPLLLVSAIPLILFSPEGVESGRPHSHIHLNGLAGEMGQIGLPAPGDQRGGLIALNWIAIGKAVSRNDIVLVGMA